MKKIRVAVLTTADLNDRKIWSGIPHFIYKSLKYEFDEVVVLGPVKVTGSLTRLIASLHFRLSKGVSLISKKLFNKRHNHDDSWWVSAMNASFFKKRLREEGPFDLIIAIASPTAVSLLTTKTPIFNVGDATYKLLHGYYPYISNLINFSRYETFIIERQALRKASYNIYASQWAANSAIKDYGVENQRAQVIPFGANIEVAPPREDIIHNDFSYRLLFLGVDWERKGGPIAFECLTRLVESGINVHLTVCGCVPPDSFQHSNLEVIPFLDKNNPVEYKRLVALMKEADFLLLPTRAECYGIVFCEASAYGTPSITTNTGGVGSAVEDGVNGFKLPLSAQGNDYAKLIAGIYANKDSYLKLSISAREYYEKVINWTVWSKKVRNLFDNLPKD
ncbi:MAG: glycosyltransferase [Hymenobacter sp.]|nr:MAG: glycosyltransferase [Hymenobacter sp.]